MRDPKYLIATAIKNFAASGDLNVSLLDEELDCEYVGEASLSVTVKVKPKGSRGDGKAKLYMLTVKEVKT